MSTPLILMDPRAQEISFSQFEEEMPNAAAQLREAAREQGVSLEALVILKRGDEYTAVFGVSDIPEFSE